MEIEIIPNRYETTESGLQAILATHRWDAVPEIEVEIAYGDLSVSMDALCGDDDSWSVVPGYTEVRTFWFHQGVVRRIPNEFLEELSPEGGLKGNGFRFLQKISLTNQKAQHAYTLIEQLGAESYRERRAARNEFQAIGLPALGALLKAAKSSDPEIRLSAKELLPIKCEERLELPIWLALEEAYRHENRQEALSVLLNLRAILEDWKIAHNIPYAIADLACYSGPDAAQLVWSIDDLPLQEEVLRIISRRMLQDKDDGGPVFALLAGLGQSKMRVPCLLAMLENGLSSEQPSLYDKTYKPSGTPLRLSGLWYGFRIPDAWQLGDQRYWLPLDGDHTTNVIIPPTCETQSTSVAESVEQPDPSAGRSVP